LSESINAFMLAEGLALINQEAIGDDKTPEDVQSWTQFEDEAREGLLGLWQNEGNAVVSDDDN